MSEEIKFTDGEIENLQDLQKGYLEVQSQFGQVAIARITIDKQVGDVDEAEKTANDEVDNLQIKERELVESLTEKYGQGTLDPKTGVFSPTPNKN